MKKIEFLYLGAEDGRGIEDERYSSLEEMLKGLPPVFHNIWEQKQIRRWAQSASPGDVLELNYRYAAYIVRVNSVIDASQNRRGAEGAQYLGVWCYESGVFQIDDEVREQLAHYYGCTFWRDLTLLQKKEAIACWENGQKETTKS